MSVEEKKVREKRIQEMKNKPFPGVRFISCVLAFFAFALMGMSVLRSYMYHRSVAIKQKQKEEQRRDDEFFYQHFIKEQKQ